MRSLLTVYDLMWIVLHELLPLLIKIVEFSAIPIKVITYCLSGLHLYSSEKSVPAWLCITGTKYESTLHEYCIRHWFSFPVANLNPPQVCYVVACK